MYRIGLDIGTTSVGWAVLNTDINGEPNRIIDMGVRIFDAAENPQDGSSLARPRREARSARRRNRRHRHRMDRIKSLLESENFIKKKDLERLYNTKQNTLKDIYEIRFEALNRKLSKEELARLLIHLAQRRGFKSNRKNEDKKSEGGKLLSATSENALYMQEKGYLTVGEMLYKDEKFKDIKRNKDGKYSNTFLRSQIEDEVNIIFDRQKEFENEHISDSLISKYKDILFSQRDFDEGPACGPYSGNQIEKMTGECTFEKGEKRAPKASYTFEYFNLLQKVNSIKIANGGIKRELTAEEKRRIITLCHKTKDITYSKIRKELCLGDTQYFNSLTYGNKSIDEVEKAKFQYLPAYHEMRAAFDKLSKGYITNISVSQRNIIATALTYHKTDEKILSALESGDFTNREKEVILGIKNFSGFGNLSLKAMENIIPYLEKGLTYDKACRAAGYNFKGGYSEEKSKYLPKLPDDTYDITSPVVKRSINQTIKVINAIVKKYGSPAIVNIELAREMSKNFDGRKAIEKEQKENADNNRRVYQEIKDTFKIVSPTGQDIIKYRLWQEQQGVCLYTNEPIKAELLFSPGYCEIDHIIPYSISFDDSFSNKALVMAYANREKGNRVPLQYVKSPDDFIGLVNTLIKNRAKRQKLLKSFISPEEENEIKERSLKDTQFITSFMANYIRDHLLFDEMYSGKQKVISVNGRVTAYMRKRWGISKFRDEGDKHHAIDAVVVACISQGIIKNVTDYFKQAESYYQNRNVNFKEKDFPLPWPEFRTELDIRTCKAPLELLEEVNLPNYSDVDISSIKPIFVSRMVRKKNSGQAHEATIRSARDITADGVTEKKLVSKTALQALKLDKNGEIENYYNPSSDRLLYELLRDSLIKAGGNGKKAFPEGYVWKPNPKGGKPNKVNKVKTYEPSSLNVPVNNGKGAAKNSKENGMLRIDLYKVEGDGYYFVPVYAADLVGELPNKAVVRGKKEWKTMRDEDFLFSVYPNDLLLVEHKNEMKFSANFKDTKLPKEYSTKQEFVYFKKAGISVASINVVTHDNGYGIASLGIKTLKNIEKYYVDVLGNRYRAPKEERKAIR